MVGRVGDDAFSPRLLNNLTAEQIEHRHVAVTDDCASGLAIVAVEQSGQNAIMVVSGANGRVGPDDIRAAREVIAASDIVLLQLEIPIESVVAAIEAAREAGVRTILDPAPAPADFPASLLEVDWICPNESEAAALTGLPVESLGSAETAARALFERGAKRVTITMGDRGCLTFDGQSVQHSEPHEVRAVDTTAAGDAFAGALAVKWAEGAAPEEAVAFANAAGAIAASRPGAQPSMAQRQEIETLWSSRR